MGAVQSALMSVPEKVHNPLSMTKSLTSRLRGRRRLTQACTGVDRFALTSVISSNLEVLLSW